ncbi:FKBP-type peptidyl-prolyl cis-trans isomerase [Flammeovirga aprica]|uniref:Peptidyl-prolyl cis-trans isomerase n=1 Tax=Flammeovirga aprica JL-4 TaxID=694437 RepID=A0A7X9RZB3_9BACT|nr:FKBP-type peptidyl-prolyl cis-trans isomerase [Flammeovirga aprica]NME71505.1 FKBP-type peptidyl-prolyl cis-trans isomerase [Flammeovirga aprica JL-4]
MQYRIRHYLLLLSTLFVGFSCSNTSSINAEIDFDAAEDNLIREYIIAGPPYFSADSHEEADEKYNTSGVFLSSITPEDEIMTDRNISLGDSMHVTYTGWVLHGDIFDSNRLSDTPFPVVLGKSSVIEGWNIALRNLHEKQEARVIIPSRLGYGASGTGSIPPNATLVFDIKVDSLWTVDEQ